jgi:hypothetical protein
VQRKKALLMDSPPRMAWKGKTKRASGVLKGFFDPFVGLVSQEVMDQPAAASAIG